MFDFLFQEGVGSIIGTVLITVIFIFIIFKFLQFVIDKYWISKRYYKWLKKQKFVLLAIDVPYDNIRTPQAVEQILSTLWGSYTSIDWKDILWYGRRLLPYSLEIISLGGYIQFLIWVPAEYKDLVEAAIYSQYPDTEIVEVKDYTSYCPRKFPAKGWNMWGCEFQLTKDFVYPLKTYSKFEHKTAKEFSDPLAGILEIFSKIQKGEQIWFQIIIKPVDDSWQDRVLMEAHILSGMEGAVKKKRKFKKFSLLNKKKSPIYNPSVPQIDLYSSNENNTPPSYIQYLTPGEKNIIESVQNKATKTGFQTTIRYIYLAKDGCFNKSLGVAGIIGAMKQFSSPDLNSLMPCPQATTIESGLRGSANITKIQNKLLSAFRLRDLGIVDKTRFILNTEEIATIWHFPGEGIKTPSIKKTGFKVLEPPSNLPIWIEGKYKEINNTIKIKPPSQGLLSDNIKKLKSGGS